MVGALLFADGRLLLGHRAPSRTEYPDVWDMVGGHVEPGESAVAALVREVREEVGVLVRPGDPWQRIKDVALSVDLTIWLCTEWEGQVTNVAPEEHDQLRWFGLDEALQLRYPHESYRNLVMLAFGEISGDHRA